MYLCRLYTKGTDIAEVRLPVYLLRVRFLVYGICADWTLRVLIKQEKLRLPMYLCRVRLLVYRICADCTLEVDIAGCGTVSRVPVQTIQHRYRYSRIRYGFQCTCAEWTLVQYKYSRIT